MLNGTPYHGIMDPPSSGSQSHNDGLRILARLIVRRILRETVERTDSDAEDANDITLIVADESDRRGSPDERM